jgi:thiosulfate/3-mercaptopyruvate sulfurtransferase
MSEATNSNGTTDPAPEPTDLVTPAWLEANRHRDIRLIEIAGMGQDDFAAYKAGHVPGAAVWKWKEALWDARMREFPSPEEFARRMGAAGIGNDTIVVVYGEGIQFGIYAWWTLRYCGHADVRLLDGGRKRWVADGRALTTDVPETPAPRAYHPTPRREEMRILRDRVVASLGNPEIAIVDARSPEEYRGERVGGPGGPDVGAVRPGRIPGARHLFYMDLFDETQSFKPKAEIAAMAAERGLSPDKATIAYCRMSHRATVAYFALTRILGYPDVRVYDGSWTEWGNLVGAPIER